MKDLLARLMQDAEQRKGELLELLGSLVRFATPAPPARNTREAQQFVADYLDSLGFAVDMWEVYPGDPNVVAVRKGTEGEAFRSLILNGHIDVAETAPDEPWISSPFEPLLQGDVIIGRGVADMKGGLAGALFALRLLHDAGIHLPGDVIMQSVIGEEVGEAGTLQCCSRGYTADLAVVVDTSDLHLQGQGGVITGWITVKSGETFHDGNRRRLIHAGGGLYGASAIEKMAKLIHGLQELERHWGVTKSYPGCPPGSNTINPAVIEGGRHAAFVADECRLWITVHYYPDETFEQVCREIEDHILAVAAADPWLRENPPRFVWGGTSMIEDRGEIFPALQVDPSHPGVALLARVHQQVTGTAAIMDISPTVTDGGWFGHAGIPAVIYGPGKLQHAHAVNEQLEIAQLMDYTKVLLGFILQWSHTRR